jgi:ABC-type Fe3+ transport system substrate-binding protein
MPQMTARITQEVAAGQTATTDILLGTVEHFAPIVNRGVLDEFDYSALSPRINRKMMAPRNIGVEIYTSTGGIVYNTQLVSGNDVPRKLEDVLKPKWKGKIASTPYAAYFNRVVLRPEWGPEKMKAFVTRLSEYVGGLIRVNEVSRVVSGEFVMLVLASSQDVTLEKAKGAPVDFTIPEDAAVAHFAYMGVPRTAANPNLGKLFINMILSEEGQKLLNKTHASDHHELPGSQTGERLNALKAKGVDILRVDVKKSLEHPETREIQAELVKILNRKPGS